MGKSYIPENTFAVCTNQVSSSPQKFIRSREYETVFLGKELFLTKKDRNTDKPFTCKNPTVVTAALLAFGAGLVLGALLVSNPLGWLVLGFGFLILGAIHAGYTKVTHTCTAYLKLGDWVNVHKDVIINGHEAITHDSLLSCNAGGILKVFFSYESACKAADDVKFYNRWEVGTNGIIALITGLTLPIGLMTLVGKLGLSTKLAGVLVGGHVSGLLVTWTALWIEKEALRNDSDMSNNEVYQDMNEIEGNSWFPGRQGLNDPSDPNDMDLYKFLQAVKNGEVEIKNRGLLNKLKSLENLSRPQLAKNPVAIDLHRALLNGKYPELKSAMNNFNAKYMRPNMLKDSFNKIKRTRAANARNFFKNIKSSFSIAFFLPLGSTYFSEKARKAFAEAAVKDVVGINVIANYPAGVN